MTREEAIRIQRSHPATNIVDILTDLGMLQLDEPKSAETKAIDVLQRFIDHRAIPIALAHLKGAGLKIVEK